MGNQNCTIYALCDPITNKIRYIGQTTLNPLCRLTQHINNALGYKNKSHLYCWIRKLNQNNQRPKVKILQENAEWNVDEITWIEQAKLMGIDLVNHTRGGNGIVGYKHTDEVKKKIGKASKGNKYAENTKHSKETNEKRIESRKWYKHSKETKKKISEKHKKSVLCIETGNIYDSAREAEKEMGVCKSSITNAINGKSKTSAGFHWRHYNG